MVEKSLPNWLKNYLSITDLQLIEASIKQAEYTTKGEIVPVIVSRSSTIGHVFPILGSLLGSFFIIILQSTSLWWYTHPFFLIIFAFSMAFLLAWPLSRLIAIQRFFITPNDLTLQTRRRAELEFFQCNLNETKDHTGILIFISLLEHHVHILADKGIAEKIKAETWEEIAKIIIDAIHQKKLANGLAESILRCGALVTEHFPSEPKNPNELKDLLIIKE